MAKKKEKEKPHELTEMDVQFVSLVPQGANRQTKFLMVKTGEIIKAVPDADASQEEKEQAREARSKKYGIEVLQSGSALTYPSGFPTTETMYGDPCLPAGTMVSTPQGPRPIEELSEGDKVFSLKWDNVEETVFRKGRGGKNIQRIDAGVVLDTVVASEKTGIKPLLRIDTCDGEILVTPNHKFLCLSVPPGAGTTKPRELIWIKAENLNVGDRLIKANPLPGQENPGVSFARALGFFHGDGWLGYNTWKKKGVKIEGACRIELACSCKEEAEFYVNVFAEALGIPVDRIKYLRHHPNKCWIIRINDSVAARNLESFVGGRCNAKTKKIPQAIFSWNEQCIIQFLEGYVDADGHRQQDKYTTVSASYDLTRGVRDLARVVNWGTTNIYTRKPSPIQGYSSSKSYSIQLYPEKEFLNKNGRTLIFTENTDRVRLRKVILVTEEPTVDVFDIQTKTGNFIAEGFVVHNCNLKYPWGDSENNLDMGRLRNALSRFKQNYTTYSNTASRKVVFTRIVQKALAEGVEVSFDPENEVDALLPQDLQDTLQKSEGETPDEPQDGGDEQEVKQQAAADMAAWLDQASEDVEDLLLEAGMNKVEEPHQGQASEVGRETPPSRQSDSDESDKLRAKVARLEEQAKADRRALQHKEEALRKAQLRVAKIRKNAIGSSSSLVAGETTGASRTQKQTSQQDEKFDLAWRSGGDLAAAAR